MKSFNAGNWRASDWGEDEPDGVTVYRPGEESWDHLISHERQIEDDMPDAPEELREFVRRQLPKLCPRCKGEGKVWEDNCGPNMWREDCPKCRPTLAENEVSVDDLGVVQLRWLDGVPQYLHRAGWRNWGAFGSGGFEAGDAWFRANCPIDRFVTDDGTLLEFEMRDDGSAEVKSSKLHAETGTDDELDPCAWLPEHRDIARALYRFRDHERGKWRFEVKDSGAAYAHGPPGCGYRDAAGESPQLQSYPTWVRQKAEALYREKNREGEKVVFEGKVIAYKADNDLQLERNLHGHITGHSRGPGAYVEAVCEDGKIIRVTGKDARIPLSTRNIKVTIEALGDG